jgi:hypothetical protein
MKQIWTGQVAQVAAKYGENAPIATVCCNACKTCATANLISLGMAGVMAAGAGIARFARRYLAAVPRGT